MGNRREKPGRKLDDLSTSALENLSRKDKLGKISMDILFKRKILEVSFHKNSEHPVLFHAIRSVSQKEYEEILEEMNNEN